ncbi:hypothetical protein TNCV_353221 [Trichonephila clavipes]|nr:hypothetical protein TNCV_353221 [Trichonephila clavipes]
MMRAACVGTWGGRVKVTHRLLQRALDVLVLVPGQLVKGVTFVVYFVLPQDFLDCDIHFSYVWGHSGNLSNDRADQLAKEATCQDMNHLMYVPWSHWKNVAWERTVSSWNTEFLALPKALWTKRFFPTIYQRLKCRKFVTDFKLSQILQDMEILRAIYLDLI